MILFCILADNSGALAKGLTTTENVKVKKDKKEEKERKKKRSTSWERLGL